MKVMFHFSSARLVQLILVSAAFDFSAPAASVPQRLWQPSRDEVYLQEIGHKVTASAPLTSVAVYRGSVFTGSATGLQELQSNELVEVSALREPVSRLVTAGGALWVITSRGLHRFQNEVW